MTKHRILSTEIRTITTRNGRSYRKRVAIVECPTCLKVYVKIHYHERNGECKECALRHWHERCVGRSYKSIGELNGNQYRRYKEGAKNRGIYFNVSQQFLWDLFVKQKGLCKLSGLLLNLRSNYVKNSSGKCRGTHYDTHKITASLDRIDNTRAYTEDNVQWVHKCINLMKGALSDSDFIYFCKKVSKVNKNKDNTEPSLLNGGNFVQRKVQRLTVEGKPNNTDTRIPQPETVDDIV